MVTFDTIVTEVIPRTPHVKSFRFKPKEGAEFKAGQFFFVTIKADGAEQTKHFSFSNSPTEKGYIEFTKRITKSPFSKALDSLKAGGWARIKMPNGSFTLEGEDEKIAFLSGGIGITPIRSMCRYAADMKLSTDMVLLYGNNTEEDIIFKEDLNEIGSLNKKMRIVYTLTSPDIDKNWQGRTGYIDEKMIKEEIPDYRERVFYICGPPKMVEALANILKSSLGIGGGKIRLENFAGY